MMHDVTPTTLCLISILFFSFLIIPGVDRIIKVFSLYFNIITQAIHSRAVKLVNGFFVGIILIKSADEVKGELR